MFFIMKAVFLSLDSNPERVYNLCLRIGTLCAFLSLNAGVISVTVCEVRLYVQ